MLDKIIKFIKKEFVLTLIIILTIAAIFNTVHKKYHLKFYEKEGVAIITKLEHLRGPKYELYFEYIIDNKKYVNYTSVRYFTCENGMLGCIGEQFNIKYSSKNPEISIIDLGYYKRYEYEKL